MPLKSSDTFARSGRFKELVAQRVRFRTPEISQRQSCISSLLTAYAHKASCHSWSKSHPKYEARGKLEYPGVTHRSHQQQCRVSFIRPREQDVRTAVGQNPMSQSRLRSFMYPEALDKICQPRGRRVFDVTCDGLRFRCLDADH